MVPKSGPHSGSQKVRFYCSLLHLSKVRRLRNGPILGAVWGPVLHKIRKNEETEDAQKIGAEKRSPSRKIRVYPKLQRLPDSPLARPEQETIWATTATTTATVAAAVAQCWFFLLDVVFFCSMLIFGFQNCPVLDETCKKRMLLIGRVQWRMIWHALGQGPANYGAKLSNDVIILF